MTDIGAQIKRLTLNNAGVAGLVGTHMYSDGTPQDASRVRGNIPAITYRIIDTVPNESLSGIVNVSRSRVEISAISDSRGEANDLAELIRTALQRQHRGTTDGVYIHEITLATGAQYLVEREPPLMGSAIRFYVTTQDFFVTYRI